MKIFGGRKMLAGATFFFVFATVIIFAGKCKSEKIKENKFYKFFYKWLYESKYDEFLVNICITVISVLLAISLTNFDAERKDAKTTISLLTSLDQELESLEKKLEEFYIPLHKWYAMSGKEEELWTAYEWMPIHRLCTLEPVMENEVVITNVNSYSYGELVDLQQSFDVIYSDIEAAEILDDKLSEIELLKRNVTWMRSLIANEISFQKKDVKEDDMKERVEQIRREYLGNEED